MGTGTLMLHMPPNLEVIALDVVSIISPSILIFIVLGCIILDTVLPLGPLAIVIGILIVIPLTLIGSLSWGFLQCLLSPFYSCH